MSRSQQAKDNGRDWTWFQSKERVKLIAALHVRARDIFAGRAAGEEWLATEAALRFDCGSLSKLYRAELTTLQAALDSAERDLIEEAQAHARG